MRDVPAVSIVIPTYNGAELLRETLAHVFAQTFSDYEVIVVDDGSTDGVTAAMLDEFAAADRIRLVRQANAGIGMARNRGIDAARGKYVCPLDHDDLWMPGKLAAQVAYHEAIPELVSSSVQWATSAGPEVPRIDRAELRCDARGLVAHPVGSNCFVSACLMFHRGRVGTLRYETRRGAAEDLPFQLEMLALGPFGVVSDEILTIYRTHAGNESSSSSYYEQTARFMQELRRAGRFDRFAPVDRGVIDALFASIAQQAFARLILDRRRAAAARLLVEQASDLYAAGRFKFLAAAPLALLAPRSLVRRRWRRDPVMP